MLDWANRYSIFCFLDNHNYQTGPHSFECLLAAGAKRQFSADPGRALPGLQHFVTGKPGWFFGHLGYDLKNEIENLSSGHKDLLQFPGTYFFEPEILIRLSESALIIESGENANAIFKQIIETEHTKAGSVPPATFQWQKRFSKDDYIKTIEQLKKHILRGDCYEINFCQEFFADNIFIDPVEVYRQLCLLSPNPFSALYKLDNKFLICASPERFLRKEGRRILSQPIKGTASRFLQDENRDIDSRRQLHLSPKERSENVMVVDLVRNDLSRICEEGSVRVDELYGIYSFPQVHQMISTVSGELKVNASFEEIIKATFPMGSMTGAPKRRVMELIEQYERSRRGIFSGALGYISPAGDFDFNVVIRSIMYHAGYKYLSVQAGSGITFYSDPEMEYEECLLKAAAMKKAVING